MTAGFWRIESVHRVSREVRSSSGSRFRRRRYFALLKVRLGLSWPFPDPRVVAVGFHGSETVAEMVLVRSQTVGGPVFGRGAEKCEGLLQIYNFQIAFLVQRVTSAFIRSSRGMTCELYSCKPDAHAQLQR